MNYWHFQTITNARDCRERTNGLDPHSITCDIHIKHSKLFRFGVSFPHPRHSLEIKKHKIDYYYYFGWVRAFLQLLWLLPRQLIDNSESIVRYRNFSGNQGIVVCFCLYTHIHLDMHTYSFWRGIFSHVGSILSSSIFILSLLSFYCRVLALKSVLQCMIACMHNEQEFSYASDVNDNKSLSLSSLSCNVIHELLLPSPARTEWLSWEMPFGMPSWFYLFFLPLSL